MPCLRHTSAVFAPASCSCRIAMICSSLNRLRFIVRPPSGGRTLLKSGGASGAQVNNRCQITKNLGLEQPLRRRQHYAVDQTADDLAGLRGGARLVKRGSEVFDLLPIEDQEPWMQAHHRFGSGRSKSGRGGFLLVLESGE